jgi:hypothetical protein
MRSDAPRRTGAPALALLLLLAPFACATAARAQPATRPDPAYDAAVRDAATALPGEISKNLVAVVRTNADLVWESGRGCGRVLVATWVDAGTFREHYEKRVGQPYTLPCRDTWVTVAPEVRNFCAGLRMPEAALALRLKQRLGLPPTSDKAYFVEFWVEPEDLFRPCPDPEVSDQECGLSFPQSKFVSVSLDYVNWFIRQTNDSYGANGYPWTRLGYTYDWGDPNHVGPSEFVIRPGATVKIQGGQSTAEYCAGTGRD